jgi:hypothetical protein
VGRNFYFSWSKKNFDFMESEFMTSNQELVKIISSQVGASNFKSYIQSHVVMGYKLSFFWYQVNCGMN